MTYLITLANDFIRNSTDDVLAKNGITGNDATTVRQFRAEARFLRAYQYWVMMDLFANPPFVTDATAVGSVIPPQTDRATLFAYIESELKAIDPLMAAPMANVYGRADQGAAPGRPRLVGRAEHRHLKFFCLVIVGRAIEQLHDGGYRRLRALREAIAGVDEGGVSTS